MNFNTARLERAAAVAPSCLVRIKREEPLFVSPGKEIARDEAAQA